MISKYADICIIGCGVAGLSFASELVSTGRTIAIIDLNLFKPPRPNSNDFFDIRAGRSLVGKTAMGIGVGGSANFWSGRLMKFSSTEFESWGIGASDREKYYNEALQKIGLSERYFDRINSQFVSEHLSDHFCAQKSVWCDPRLSYLTQAWEKIQQCANVTLIEGKCEKLKFSHNYQSVTEAIIKNENVQTTVNARNFFLAANGVETPRILLSSNDGAQEIRKKFPAIGRYLCIRPKATIGTTQAIIKSSHDPLFGDIECGDGVFSRVCLGISKGVQHKCMNHQIQFTPIENHFLKKIKLFFGNTNEGSKYHLSKRSSSQMTRLSVKGYFDEVPSKRNCITLSNETCDYGFNKPRIEWTRPTTFDENVNHFVSDIFDNTSAFDGGFTWKKSLENIKSLNELHSHFLGTTRLGDDESRSVVDSNLKMHGCDNLFICGPQVLPTSGHANPLLTVLALALRLSARFTHV